MEIGDKFFKAATLPLLKKKLKLFPDKHLSNCFVFVTLWMIWALTKAQSLKCSKADRLEFYCNLIIGPYRIICVGCACAIFRKKNKNSINLHIFLEKMSHYKYHCSTSLLPFCKNWL